jgi:signal peptidase II
MSAENMFIYVSGNRMNNVKKIIMIFVVAAVCIGCDQITKSMAKDMLPVNYVLSYLGGTVRFRLVYNSGAFLGMGAYLPEIWRTIIFIIGSGCLIIGVLVFAFVSKTGRPSVIFSIALLFAGGAGNLIDRIAYHGFVVDFINVGIGPVRTGIFNVADMAVTFGAFLLFLTAMRRQEKENS